MRPTPALTPETSSESNWKNLNPLHAARDLADASQALGKLRDSTDASDAPARSQNRRKFARAIGGISLNIAALVLALLGTIAFYNYRQGLPKEGSPDVTASATAAPGGSPAPSANGEIPAEQRPAAADEREAVLGPAEGYGDCMVYKDYGPDIAALSSNSFEIQNLRQFVRKGMCSALQAIERDPRNMDLLVYVGANWRKMAAEWLTSNALDNSMYAKTVAQSIFEHFQNHGKPVLYAPGNVAPTAGQLSDSADFAYADLASGQPDESPAHAWHRKHRVPYYDASKKTLYICNPAGIGGFTKYGEILLSTFRQFLKWSAMNDAYMSLEKGVNIAAAISNPSPALILGNAEKILETAYHPEDWAGKTSMREIHLRLRTTAELEAGKIFNDEADPVLKKQTTETLMYGLGRWLIQRRLVAPNDPTASQIKQLLQMPHVFDLESMIPE